MGDFVIFSYFFRISRLEGSLYSVAPQGDRKIIADPEKYFQELVSENY